MIVTISISESPDNYEDMDVQDFGEIEIEIPETFNVYYIKGKIADALRAIKEVDVIGLS